MLYHAKYPIDTSQLWLRKVWACNIPIDKCFPLEPAASISSLDNSRAHIHFKNGFSMLRMAVSIFLRGTWDETAAEGDFIPSLYGAPCPSVWPHTHYDVPAGERERRGGGGGGGENDWRSPEWNISPWLSWFRPGRKPHWHWTTLTAYTMPGREVSIS